LVSETVFWGKKICCEVRKVDGDDDNDDDDVSVIMKKECVW
jgi:hypothetical protein